MNGKKGKENHKMINGSNSIPSENRVLPWKRLSRGRLSLSPLPLAQAKQPVPIFIGSKGYRY